MYSTVCYELHNKRKCNSVSAVALFLSASVSERSGRGGGGGRKGAGSNTTPATSAANPLFSLKDLKLGTPSNFDKD